MASITNLTLQKRVILLVLAGLVAGLGLFSWLGMQSVNESIDRTLEERLTMARMMASYLDKTLTHALTELRQAAALRDGIPTQEQFDSMRVSLLHEMTEDHVFLQNITILDKDGKVVRASPDDLVLIGTDMTGSPEVKEVLSSGMPAISGLVSSPLTEVPMVLISVPILDREGEIVGALASSIDIERSIIGIDGQIVTVGNTGYTEIVDSNGIVLARTEPGFPPEMFERSDHPGRFAELISQGEATVGRCHRCHEAGGEIERRQDVLAFAPLSVASWGVVLRQSEEEALAPARQMERRFLLLAIILMVGSFPLVWTIMQGVVKPVRMLTLAAKKWRQETSKRRFPSRAKMRLGS